MSRMRTAVLNAVEAAVHEEAAKLERWRNLTPDGSAAIDTLAAQVEAMRRVLVIVDCATCDVNEERAA